MKKADGNMYIWVSYIWNPVKGKCGFGCSYCYVEKTAHRFGLKQRPRRLDESELRTNLGEGKTIFVCSGIDLFHPSIPQEWKIKVMEKACSYPGNTYLWHTKNPTGILTVPSWYYPPDSILCVTIETNRRYDCMGTAGDPLTRIAGLSAWTKTRMVTVEPILDFDEGADGFARLILTGKPNQVNIGADSGNNHLPEPPREKIEELIERLAPHTKIHLKSNLRRILPESRFYEC